MTLLTYLTAKKRHQLLQRIDRFIKLHQHSVELIRIHPSDVRGALALRDLGLIPNFPIKELGGEQHPQIITQEQGE